MTDDTTRPTTTDLKSVHTDRTIEDHLRAVACNAMLEAMNVRGRQRFTDTDARRMHIIFLGLCDVKEADVLAAPENLSPIKQSAPTPMLRRWAEAAEPKVDDETKVA